MRKYRFTNHRELINDLNEYCIPKIEELSLLGNLIENPAIVVGIIGTRNATIYGERVVDLIVRELSLYDSCIVSGFMYGIDMFAHKSAYKYELPTIAVLGYGFEYLSNNKEYKFAKNIIDEHKGLFISEYEDNQNPQKWTYPKRNRIVAALSDFLIVVEAGKKSGSFITTDFALDMGKDVFTVPGSIFSKSSKGTNNLIKQGARIISEIDDIHNYLKDQYQAMKKENIKYNINRTQSGDKSKNRNHNTSKQNQQSKQNQYSKQNKYSKQNQHLKQNQLSKQIENYNETSDHQKIISTIEKYPDGVNVDMLASNIKMDISKLNSMLTELEIDEIIKKDIANKYHLII